MGLGTNPEVITYQMAGLLIIEFMIVKIINIWLSAVQNQNFIGSYQLDWVTQETIWMRCFQINLILINGQKCIQNSKKYLSKKPEMSGLKYIINSIVVSRQFQKYKNCKRINNGFKGILYYKTKLPDILSSATI